MAVVATRVTVTTSPVSLVATPDSDGLYGGTITVRNRGTVSVFLGGATVTSATGFELEPGDACDGNLTSGDVMYGIVATGTALCHVLQVGV